VIVVAPAERSPAGPRGRPRGRLGALRRVPVAARWVALLACLNAVAWGLIVPPFHTPDEASHFFYAQYIAETGELPTTSPDANWYSGDINGVLYAEGFWAVIGRPEYPVPSTRTDQATLEEIQRTAQDRTGVGDASSASNNPPLYYLAEAVPYALMHRADVTGRLAAMRLVSALFAGLTTLCVFLFLREVLPGRPLPWTVGALAAGLQPLFGFVSSGVTNDAGLFLASAALLFAVARVLRRGITVRRAIAVGLLLGLGVLVKTQVIAFLPTAGLALGAAAWRSRGTIRAWRALAAGLLGALAPTLVYAVLGRTVWSRPLVDRVSDVTASVGSSRPWLLQEQISYLWQLYLPRMPNLDDIWPGVPAYDLWLTGFVGRFGWLDYGLDAWTYRFAGGVFVVVAVLAFTALWARRATLRGRAIELFVYVGFAGGLCVAIGVLGYRAYLIRAPTFEQARYLLPLLPLYALFPALAVSAVPRRWAAPLAVLITTGVLFHSVLAQVTTVVRYYG